MINRPRRLRKTPEIRNLVRETHISAKSLIYPLFIRAGKKIMDEIPAMPGQYHYSPDMLHHAIERCKESGVDKVLLFGLPTHKDEIGSSAWAEDGGLQQGISIIKKNFPDICVITDVCMCEYTSHGHCGILDGHTVDNDKTLEVLCKTTLSHVRAGADVIAPSDMMDGRVAAIRNCLDAEGFSDIPIMSYAAKYASGFYGPFRYVAGSAPAFGDRKSYQMDCHNAREALKECRLDEEEGADILMVKPAMSYLDIVAKVRGITDLPLAAYSVSGEYAMIKAAAASGLVDEYTMMCETAVSVFRAGADILITYYAPELAAAIRKGDIG